MELNAETLVEERTPGRWWQDIMCTSRQVLIVFSLTISVEVNQEAQHMRDFRFPLGRGAPAKYSTVIQFRRNIWSIKTVSVAQEVNMFKQTMGDSNCKGRLNCGADVWTHRITTFQSQLDVFCQPSTYERQILFSFARLNFLKLFT